MPTSPQLTQQVRIMQIITLAMVMGVVMFGVVVAVVLRPQAPAEGDQPVVTYVAIGFAMLATIAGVLVPRVLARNLPATVSTYQTTFIIGAAIYEGAAFFNLVTYMLEGYQVSFAFAGLMLVFLIMIFPTVARVEDWIASRERHQREMQAFKR